MSFIDNNYTPKDKYPKGAYKDDVDFYSDILTPENVTGTANRKVLPASQRRN